MPDRASHVRQAERNEALYSYLDVVTPTYIDWQVTALFYAALHYVNAYLSAKPSVGIHPVDHVVRDRLVASERSLRPIYAPYRELTTRSMDARYELVPFARGQLASLWSGPFQRVRAHLRSELGLAS
jgi:hypothetical protein